MILQDVQKPTECRPGIASWVIERLSRVTSSGRFVREIDGLRFFAILGVVFCHVNNDILATRPDAYDLPAQEFWSWLFQTGSVGVRLFFVISGFVLALPFAEHYLNKKKRPTLGKYLLRRLTRLEPPYFANLALFAVLRFVVLGESLGVTMPHLLASMFYVHNVAYQSMSAINQVAWSLEIEVQFYLLAPLMARVFLLKGVNLRRLVIVGLGCLFALAQRLIPEHSTLFQYTNMSILYHMQFFLAGFLLVDIFLVEWKQQPTKNSVWDIYATLAWIAMVPVLRYRLLDGFVMPGLMLVAYVGAFRGKIWNHIVSNRWIVVTGGMCYTLYLYHGKVAYIVVPKLCKLPLSGRLWIDVPLMVLVSGVFIWLAGAVLFVLLEKPFMRPDWPKRFRERLVMRPR